ncbi:MAG: hypothetical protein KGL92_12160 [Gammaproteobacteria bacterium]|nr:hypothetical protein [Gammaproteobacteria bacterium]MDE2349248.1 hypothetical protein [Gammaproteobacteria bacterium]
MRFRIRAFQWHLLASAAALLLVLGVLYAGWYRWPGWYLTGALRLVAILVGVDLALGPLSTLVIANPRKSRAELTRDVALIVAIQLLALGYGATTLWRGRPVYYAFSVNMLQLVQASDLDPRDAEGARRANSPFAPYWTSRPRWVWAPLPTDPALRARIVQSAVTGGFDVTSMPTRFKSWRAGMTALRAQLKKVGDVRFFTPPEIAALQRRMRRAGIDPNRANAIALMGRGRPLLAVFDPSTLELKALLRSD